MVLHENYWLEHLAKMKDESYSFKVLNTKHIQFPEDNKRLDFGIELVNLLNSLAMINQFFKNGEIKREIDFSILYSVIRAVYNNEFFTDAQLEDFYKFNRELEGLAKAMQSVAPDLTEHLFVSTDVEMMLIGFDFNKVMLLESIDKGGTTGDEFFNLKWKVIKNKMTVKQFKEASLKLLKNALKEEDLKHKKVA